ncbi:MAG: LytTR family DNA-binding domain-containing protein [Eubacteriales bacterium]|jgi:DNA-binding LytR/AlgR family response regulator|nr:LytTR family DNA-binding domain-containing protein [Eubacteriales bacterium]NLF46839.1 LytTR family transcriptional regulator [Clostridiales bacterium]
MKNDDIMQYEMRKKRIVVIKKKETARIPQSEILFIEQRERKIVIVTEKETFTYYGKMKDCWPVLSGCFHRCHTYLAVNLDNVRRIADGAISFFGSKEIVFLGRSAYSKTKKGFNTYLKKTHAEEIPCKC